MSSDFANKNAFVWLTDQTPVSERRVGFLVWRPIVLGDQRPAEEDEDGTKTAWGFHYLGHYHASRCLEAGMDMKELSTHMGHGSVQITMDIYTHIFEDIQAEKKRREKALARPAASA